MEARAFSPVLLTHASQNIPQGQPSPHAGVWHCREQQGPAAVELGAAAPGKVAQLLDLNRPPRWRTAHDDRLGVVAGRGFSLLDRRRVTQGAQPEGESPMRGLLRKSQR